MSRLAVQVFRVGLVVVVVVAGMLLGGCRAKEETSRQFEWSIDTADYFGKTTTIRQSAEVFFTTEQILMTANDSSYRETPTYRSTSLHDFRVGQVAFKPLGARHCFLGQVTKTFQQTVNELTLRANGGTPNLERRTVRVTGVRRYTAAGSAALRSFCCGRSLLLLTDQRFDQLPEPWIRWPPMDSVWGPVDPYRTVAKPILTERDVPSFIRWKVGPNVLFP